MDIDTVEKEISAAHAKEDWKGVLKWKGRMNEIVTRSIGHEDEFALHILKCFYKAHDSSWNVVESSPTSESGYIEGSQTPSAIGHKEASVEILQQLAVVFTQTGEFRKAGQCLCDMGHFLMSLDKTELAKKAYERARKIAETHGLYSIESQACLGLGGCEMSYKNYGDGVDLLRNALISAQFNELENDFRHESEALNSLVFALIETKNLEEAQTLMPRYEEIAMQSTSMGNRFVEFEFMVSSMLLHEV
jgi:hypothetical protein